MDFMDGPYVEITDDFRKEYVFAAFIMIFVGALILYFYYDIMVTFVRERSVWENIFISIAILGGLMLGLLQIYGITRGLWYKRYFVITEDGIEIGIPGNPYFEIPWTEFERLHVTALRPSTNFEFRVSFYGKNEEVVRSIMFVAGMDLHKSVLKTILFRLREYLDRFHKEMTGDCLTGGFGKDLMSELRLVEDLSDEE